MPLPLLFALGAAALAGRQGYLSRQAQDEIARRQETNAARFGQPGLPGLGGSGLLGALSQSGADPVAIQQAMLAQSLLNDPDAQRAGGGTSLLTNLFSNRGQATRQEDAQAHSLQLAEFNQGATDARSEASLAQSADQFAQTDERLTSQFDKQFGLAQQQALNTANQHAEAQAARVRANELAAKKIEEDRLNRGVGEGMEVYAMDNFNNRKVRPILGSEKYNQAVTEIDETRFAMDAVSQLLDIAESGRAMVGPTRARAEALRGEIVASLAQLNSLGVLTPGELEFLGETGAPAITGFGTTRASTAIGGYERVLERLHNAAVTQSRIYSGINSYGPMGIPVRFGTEIMEGRAKQSSAAAVPPPPPGATLDAAPMRQASGGRNRRNRQ